jgi:methylamine---glutamate N-methyltransferase subunit A
MPAAAMASLLQRRNENCRGRPQPMCGIVGLFLKKAKLEPELGRLVAPMLASMGDRGPDSAGFAIYGGNAPGAVKLTLRGTGATDFALIAEELSRFIGHPVPLTRRDTHAVVTVPAGHEAALRDHLSKIAPDLAVISIGRRMELYKEVGHPREVAERFGFAQMSGTHAIGHTRMATESAVTTNGAHPFSTGTDQCLVHNGSLSNHNDLRRKLVHDGLSFATDNDTEVAAGYLSWRMKQGMGLEAALTAALADLDGFYTFVVGTETGFAVLRDPIACKPAVMVETDDYVAFGSEYRALVELPGVAEGRVFEPEPAKVYVWERRA